MTLHILIKIKQNNNTVGTACQKTGAQNVEAIPIQMENAIVLFVEMNTN